MKDKKSKTLTFLLFTLVLISTIPLSSCIFSKKESVKAYKKSYRMNEIRIAEENTFKKLNNVVYPSDESPVESQLSDLEKEAYSNFSNETYHALLNSSENYNFSYATIGLYSLLNQMVGASSRSDLTTDLNTLLGLDEESREAFYKKVIKANSFASEESSTQLKNAAFFNNFYNFNRDYVDYLTKLYCEAYQLNFANEADKMVEWVNKAVNSDGFIDKAFLELTSDSELYLFSSLYFKNMWAYKYLSSDNIEDNFYLNDGSTLKTTFMKHSYQVESYYDYGSYISVKDYYKNGNASITYIVPKNVEDNIYTLTKDKNIFDENKDNLLKDETETRNWFTVNLKTPKFTLKSDINFKNSLTRLGLGSIFDSRVDSFKNAFNDERLSEYNIYVSVMKQRNEVEFNEDGTIVKSISMSGMSKADSAMLVGDTLDVNLNQPFIYIIRDINDTPIFVGHVDNPKM